MPDLTNAELLHLRELLRDGTLRRRESRFVIEGPHLIEEALVAGAELEEVYATEAFELANLALAAKLLPVTPLKRLSQKQAERLSDAVTPQGIFALVQQRRWTSKPTAPLVLLLDRIQDPGNVGTIIRTAAWFGVNQILLGEGSADPTNPKVLRATQGSLFHIWQRSHVNLAEVVPPLRRDGYKVIATRLDSSSIDAFEFSTTEKIALILGSEAHGVDESLIALSDVSIQIPSQGKGESLNVAVSAGIFLALLTRSA